MKVKLNLLQLGVNWSKKNNDNLLTNAYLSEITGIRKTTLTNYKRNSWDMISRNNIKELLKFFDVKIDELFIIEE